MEPSAPSETKWDDLSPDSLKRIAGLLSPAELACTFRLINKSVAELYRGYLVAVQLSKPVPHHAFVEYWSRPEAVRNLTLKQRQQLLVLTARSGVLENLEVAIEVAGCVLTAEVFEAAAGAGHLDICRWLLAKGCPCDNGALAAAARGGHLAVVRWLLQQKRHPAYRKSGGELAWAAAAGAGQRSVCEGLAADNVEFDWEALIAPARAGLVDVANWLLLEPPRIRPPGPPPTRVFSSPLPLFAAAAYGFDLSALQRLHHVLVGMRLVTRKEAAGGYVLPEALASPTPDWEAKVRWLLQQREPVGREFSDLDVDNTVADEIASRPDAVARVDLLLRLPMPPPNAESAAAELLLAAVQAGNVSLMRHLREGRPGLPEITEDAADVAAEAGNVAVLAELVEQGWPLRPSTVEAAAHGGHLHVLRWMAEAPEAGPAVGEAALQEAMGPELAKAAAESSSVELVTWLRERGCEWDERAFTAAVRAGCSLSFLEWLVAAGCPMPDSGDPYLQAGAHGDMAALRFLRRLGCSWGPGEDTFTRAVRGGSDDPDDHSQNKRQGRNPPCSLAVLKWLVAEGCPVDWRAARCAARGRKAGKLIDWDYRIEVPEVLSWVESQNQS